MSKSKLCDYCSEEYSEYQKPVRLSNSMSVHRRCGTKVQEFITRIFAADDIPIYCTLCREKIPHFKLKVVTNTEDVFHAACKKRFDAMEEKARISIVGEIRQRNDSVHDALWELINNFRKDCHELGYAVSGGGKLEEKMTLIVRSSDYLAREYQMDDLVKES